MVLLILDDLHWATPSTVALLRHLLGERTRSTALRRSAPIGTPKSTTRTHSVAFWPTTTVGRASNAFRCAGSTIRCRGDCCRPSRATSWTTTSARSRPRSSSAPTATPSSPTRCSVTSSSGASWHAGRCALDPQRRARRPRPARRCPRCRGSATVAPVTRGQPGAGRRRAVRAGVRRAGAERQCRRPAPPTRSSTASTKRRTPVSWSRPVLGASPSPTPSCAKRSSESSPLPSGRDVTGRSAKRSSRSTATRPTYRSPSWRTTSPRPPSSVTLPPPRDGRPPPHVRPPTRLITAAPSRCWNEPWKSSRQ